LNEQVCCSLRKIWSLLSVGARLAAIVNDSGKELQPSRLAPLAKLSKCVDQPYYLARNRPISFSLG
jgi:hypothetical protein